MEIVRIIGGIIIMILSIGGLIWTIKKVREVNTDLLVITVFLLAVAASACGTLAGIQILTKTCFL